MNLSEGFRQLGQGLQLISERSFRREENDWMAAREENLMRLRHQQGLELEGVRAGNEAAAADAQRKFVSEENDKNRKADDSRQDRADRRADARLQAEITARDGTQAMQLRRAMSEGMGRFRVEMRELEDSITKAQEAGNEAGVQRMTAQLQALGEERNDFYMQYASLLAKAGDPGFSSLSDEELRGMMGGDPAAADSPGAAERPAATDRGAATKKTKPMRPASVAVGPGGASRGGRSLSEMLKEVDAEIDAVPTVPITQFMSSDEYTAAQEQNRRHKELVEKRKNLVRQQRGRSPDQGVRPSFRESLKDTFNAGLIGP